MISPARIVFNVESESFTGGVPDIWGQGVANTARRTYICLQSRGSAALTLRMTLISPTHKGPTALPFPDQLSYMGSALDTVRLHRTRKPKPGNATSAPTIGSR